ncbi:MAG TPA: DNA polymerase I [Verrucomicrobiae bacterium]|nr:DNA polymerase I [Verrucomicrobiae bacterium]
MGKKLFLLDGMALVYRAHFALIARPIFTSKGVNTSALYGFTQTLLEILKNQQPTHIAVAFDTDAPTHRHAEFAEYKATRQAMPEDLSLALPHVRRMLEAFRIPVLLCDGWEADDIIGTVVRRAEKEGFTSYMVTPDKDFGQLIDEHTFLYKPSRMGDAVVIVGVPEIKSRWGIQRPEQVVDVLALMGDSSDNIPGVPGIGEKTAMKLIGQYGTIENLLSRVGELKGRVKETLEQNSDLARVSKRLATILCEAPCPIELNDLKLQKPEDDKVKALLVEFEFNSIGKRLYGDQFQAGHGFSAGEETSKRSKAAAEPELILEGEEQHTAAGQAPAASAKLQTIRDVEHAYRIAGTNAERLELIRLLEGQPFFAFNVQTTSPDPKDARIVGLGFSIAPHTGYYVPVPQEENQAKPILQEFRPLLESERIEKVGHNLKFDLAALKWRGLSVRGPLFDAMIAHSLIEPDLRHSIEYLTEAYLGYAPISAAGLVGDAKSDQQNMADVPLEKLAEYAAESADLSLQVRAALEPLLKEKGQEQVFYGMESQLVPVLVDMEYEGIKLDSGALGEFAAQLGKQIDEQEKAICRMAGTVFNLNSPRQLGQILFEVMKICAAPKKTKSGQYATDEQTLMALAPDHEIVQRLLEHRAATKLKSTYADALPLAIWPKTGRVHTTYYQVATSTGRLNSQNPNLQNIPIRTERGQEIRKAFVPRSDEYLLLSADYSQIELRIIAALSREAGLLEAFKSRADVHTATAAKVYGVFPELVTPEMRRKAKMVNYGIAYGISAFGLAQRLGIPRKEAAEIIDQYFKQFPGIRKYMDETVEFTRTHGYAETVTGRRRYLRDIRSSNNTIRSAAERNAINAPIQGTAADMIKIAMIHIHRELSEGGFKTRMLLQVHDELVFDLFKPEEKKVRALVEDKMKSALALDVPIDVEIGVGPSWLAAH